MQKIKIGFLIFNHHQSFSKLVISMRDFILNFVLFCFFNGGLSERALIEVLDWKVNLSSVSNVFFGKPFFSPSGYYFSISNSNAFVYNPFLSIYFWFLIKIILAHSFKGRIVKRFIKKTASPFHHLGSDLYSILYSWEAITY